VVTVQLKPHSKLKKLQFDENFADLAIKGRNSMGNIITKYPVKKIVLKSKGVSTLSGRKIWYDEILKRLNADGRGKYLGEFDGDDRVLTVMSNGIYELTSFDLNNHFDDKMLLIEKYNPEKIYTVVHYEGKSKNYMVKRFVFENTAVGKQTSIVSEESGSKLVLISGAMQPIVKVEQLKGKVETPETIEINLSELIDVKGMKAMGNRLSQHTVKSIELIAEINPVEEEPEPDISEELPEIEGSAEPSVELAESPKGSVQSPTEKHVKSSDQSVESSSKESVDPPEEHPHKKVDFEITNPDDIDIDDTGQLGLF
jgi:topoisomerase-4 subunit A